MHVLSSFDLGRGLLAVVISLALFIAVERDQNPPELGSLELPLDLVNLPGGISLIGEQPARTVQVRISAPRDSWTRLRSESVRATVDLGKATPGFGQYKVVVQSLESRARVVEVIPPAIALRLDENIERSIPVSMTRSGALPFGHEAGEGDVQPAAVLAQGPASIVNRIETARLDVKLDGHTSDIDARFAPTPLDSQGQTVPVEGSAVRLNPPLIRVRIPIQQQVSYRTVGIRPRIEGNVESGYIIDGVSVEPAAVTLVGSPQSLATVQFASTERIDVTDASASFARQVSLIVPEGVSVIQDDAARVTVEVAPISLNQAFATVPTIEDVTAGLQLQSALPAVQVVLQGPPGAMRSLQNGDIRVTASVAGLGAGQFAVTLSAAAPSGTTVQSISPRLIQVQLGEIVIPVASEPGASATPLPTPIPTRAPTASATPRSTPIPMPSPTLGPPPAPTVGPSPEAPR